MGAVKLIRSIRRKKDEVGLVTALSYSSVGGDILTIETNTTSGDGKILLTGSLGEVMKESASAALSAVKSLASDFNIDNKDFKEKDIHIHVPEGAVKKEGPSAGAALATAILSSFTGREVDANLAMTGEITIRGNVLAIGGVKEKIYAAKRAGVEKVLVPEQNREDVNELSKEVTDNMQIIFVNNLKEVAMHALKG